MSQDDQDFVEGLDAARRQKLLWNGVLSAYILLGFCTWMAACVVSSCLNPRYHIVLETGLRNEATEKIKEVKQSISSANGNIETLTSKRDRLWEAAK